MRLISTVIVLLLTISCATASIYQQESLNWKFRRGWATYDRELYIYYNFLPMTEKAHDQLSKLDRRYDYQCQVKERNLRNMFQSDTVVIAIYDLKDCVQTGRNPNWK